MISRYGSVPKASVKVGLACSRKVVLLALFLSLPCSFSVSLLAFSDAADLIWKDNR